MVHELDGIASRLFLAALAEQRCGELLDCLFSGGSATVDASGSVVLVAASQLTQLGGDE